MSLRTLAAVPLLALALAACGGSGSESASSTGAATSTATEAQEHNDADVTFAQDMVPHHRQALEMTELAVEQSTGASAEVVDLAMRIATAQGPEIEEMTGWLEAWEEEVPEAMGGMDHSGMDGMGGMGMQGMASADELTALGEATGEEFDQQFLTLMIAHHEGAVQQSETELADGTYGPARELAQEIIDSQQAEIEEMTALLEG